MSDSETVASLLGTIALIREAAGVGEKPMLSELPDEIKRLREERDEARRRICEDAVSMGDVYRRVDGRNVRLSTPREVAEMMGWHCFDAMQR